MPKPVQELLHSTEELQKNFKRLLTGTDMVHTLPEFDSLFRRILFRLQAIGAVTEPEHVKATNGIEFKPITDFMGEKIKTGAEIKKADLNPKEAEKQAFRFSVDKLYKELPTLNPHSVLQSYTLPEHILIIRGVAKKAGVVDFEKREMTVQFIEDIILAIEMKEEEAGNLKKLDEITKGQQLTAKTLTQDDIDKDPELQKIKAVAGDELIISPDGKKKLQKAKYQ